jgi:hypothetical protein
VEGIKSLEATDLREYGIGEIEQGRKTERKTSMDKAGRRGCEGEN